LPEKHPVIVFKDASEQILNDLLEFMYRGEVEVDEANLSDFLKFANTLQVKGLSHGENTNPAWKPKEEADNIQNSNVKLGGTPTPTDSNVTTTPSSTPPITIKDPIKLTGIPEPVATMNKAYHFSSALANLQPNAKFANFFPGLQQAANGGLEPSQAQDLYSHLASPNLFNALKRKYPVALGQKQVPGFDGDSPTLKMPFLKDYFGKPPLDLSYPNMKEEDSDDIAEPSPPPQENGTDDSSSHGMESLNLSNIQGDKMGPGGQMSRKPQGRGSRLERMIAAEYKILSEYSEAQNGQATPPEGLPAITPELMKSRRTHSLQLAIGEILHNRASVQSAATKYHIPRETLRRHYQRYLKAMGINKATEIPGQGQSVNVMRPQSATPTKSIASPIETLAAAAAAANAASTNEESSNYSSLLDIGQAYGIWAPGEDNSNDMSGPRDLKIVEDEDEESLSNEKEIVEPLKIEHQEIRLESSTPTGIRESQNNNNVPTEKSLTAPRIMPMETA